MEKYVDAIRQCLSEDGMRHVFIPVMVVNARHDIIGLDLQANNNLVDYSSPIKDHYHGKECRTPSINTLIA